MALAIRLLGWPRVELDGEAVPPPRGRKTWALLAYLVAARAPVPRERLASLLFADADDPLGALRWYLADLRRLLGDSSLVRGPALELELEPGTYVDVHALESASCEEALAVEGLGHELLEGMTFPGCPSFEVWLVSERRHLEAAAAAALREGSLELLGREEHAEAAEMAAALVSLTPYDDSAHELLVRAHAEGGDAGRAAECLAACREQFRRELGREPALEVVAAAAAAEAPRMDRPRGRAGALAELEAGEAAVAAGAGDTGVACLRRAVAESAACGDEELHLRAVLALGRGLMDTAATSTDEIAGVLHTALAGARAADDSTSAGSALASLGLLEALNARYERAMRWLDQALAAGESDPATVEQIDFYRAVCLTDTGRYRGALAVLARAAEARGERDPMRLLEHGRIALLRGEHDAAHGPLARSAELLREAGNVAWLPLPEAFLGRLAVAEGRLDEASELLEHSFALSCSIDDPCWQALSGSALALLAFARGDGEAATERAADALRRGRKDGMHWRWAYASALDVRAKIAIALGDPGAGAAVDELEGIAARAGMRELLARAHLHRHALGEPAALGAATLVAEPLENPALGAALEAGRAQAVSPASASSVRSKSVRGMAPRQGDVAPASR